ncbi:MAG: glycosyltransferase, partial [Thermoguttaceae bacterium]|nr:glycosyltransferase [Thermoguttaceae bacterium]
MIEYSLVVPVFNEEESLRLLYDEIVAVAETLSAKIELIFVDDGSTDKSWTIIEELVEKDERVRGIRFRRNFGK